MSHWTAVCVCMCMCACVCMRVYKAKGLALKPNSAKLSPPTPYRENTCSFSRSCRFHVREQLHLYARHFWRLHQQAEPALTIELRQYNNKLLLFISKLFWSFDHHFWFHAQTFCRRIYFLKSDMKQALEKLWNTVTASQQWRLQATAERFSSVYH